MRAPRSAGRSRSAPPMCMSRSRSCHLTQISFEAAVEKARRAHAELAGVELIWRQDCYQLASGRTSFGFKDGIGQPAVEGSGRPATNPRERPLKAGEIVLGYPDETGELPPMPTPEVLGRNGTYVVFRKLHTRVAAYRQLPARQGSEPPGGGTPRREDGRTLAERRTAGAVARTTMTPSLERPAPQQRLPLRRRPAWLQVPGRRPRPASQPSRRTGSGRQRRRPAPPDDPARHQLRPHARRRRDSTTTGSTVGSSSSSLAPTSNVSSSSSRPSGSTTASSSAPRSNPTPWSDLTTARAVSPSPIVRSDDRLQNLPPFVVTRGGEYCFAPSLRALRWLAELDT